MIKRRVLFLVNHDVVIYNFRLELVERLLRDGYEVHISSPYGPRIEDLLALGCKYYDANIERHGMNPLSELRLLNYYKDLLEKIQPDIVFGFTIKPNIYGAIAAANKNIPFVANITGLGTAVENKGIQQRIFILLYRYAFRKIQRVFFQNESNRQFFIKNRIAAGKDMLIPGSGVNITRFRLLNYPSDSIIRFAFISRIMKEKGIDIYLEAAKIIKRKYKNIEFHVCGFCEKEYKGKLQEYNDENIVLYHGMVKDVAGFLEGIHCVVHPTFYPEGLSNVLLEACACGRPVITTDRSGCREVVENGENGYLVPEKNINLLIDTIFKFISLSNEEKKLMGLKGRKKVELEFDRNKVVESYMDEIRC